MKKKLIRLSTLLISLIIVLTFVGCNQTKDKAGDTETPSESKTSEEEKKGELPDDKKATQDEYAHENSIVRIALGGAASTSDPFAHSNVVDRAWITNSFETLFCYNGITGERESRVGKDLISISEDGLTYRVEIFDNVYFQNGKHCTADDIRRSFEYAKLSTYNIPFSGVVDRVEVVDDVTVDIILKEPSSPFLSNWDQIYILDMDEVEAQGDQFGLIASKAGSGAYYIDKYDPAVEIVMKYHDQFHRPLPEGKRPIQELIFKVMTDASARDIAFEAGDLDFVSVSPANYAALEESGKYNTKLGQSTQCVYYVVNGHQGAPFNNKLIRQAIAYACDYDSMLAAGYENQGLVTGKLAHPDYTIAGPQPKDTIVYSYQPEKAKELLVEAGYPDGVDLGYLSVISGGTHEKIAQVMQNNLADVGMTIQLATGEQVTTISDMREGKYTIMIMGTYYMMDYDYLSSGWDILDKPTAGVKMQDLEGYDYEKVAELVVKARETTDEDERRALYTELEGIHMDAAIHVPILHTALPYAWDKDLYINTNKPYTYQYTHFWDCYWE